MRDLAKRLAKIEGAFESHALVLRRDDGGKAILPYLADLDLFFAFMSLMHRGDFSHRGKPIPPAWLHAFAHSIPTAGEGLCMASCRELSRRYLNGEDLSA